MIVKFFNIKYDTEGKNVKLPSQLVFDDFDDEEDYELDSEGADYISDHVGYLVESYEYEILDTYCEQCKTETPYTIFGSQKMICFCCGTSK